MSFWIHFELPTNYNLGASARLPEQLSLDTYLRLSRTKKFAANYRVPEMGTENFSFSRPERKQQMIVCSSCAAIVIHCCSVSPDVGHRNKKKSFKKKENDKRK
jgi:hypothetical protein